MLLALALALRTARIAGVNPNQLWNSQHRCTVYSTCGFAPSAGHRQLDRGAHSSRLAARPGHDSPSAAGSALVRFLQRSQPRSLHVGSRCRSATLRTRWPRRWLSVWHLSSSARCWPAPAAERRQRCAGAWSILIRWPRDGAARRLAFPVHPVQAYAALAFLTIACLLLVWLPHRRQRGDIAGFWLVAAGAAVYFTEFWRDPEGRGAICAAHSTGPSWPPLRLCWAVHWSCASVTARVSPEGLPSTQTSAESVNPANEIDTLDEATHE